MTPVLGNLPWAQEANIKTGADYLRTWVACAFRDPFEPTPYLFLWGNENSGKSILHEALEPAGDKGRRQSRQGVSSNNEFNGELAGAIICAVEEKNLSNYPRAYARIKEWVTALQRCPSARCGQTPIRSPTRRTGFRRPTSDRRAPCFLATRASRWRNLRPTPGTDRRQAEVAPEAGGGSPTLHVYAASPATAAAHRATAAAGSGDHGERAVGPKECPRLVVCHGGVRGAADRLRERLNASTTPTRDGRAPTVSPPSAKRNSGRNCLQPPKAVCNTIPRAGVNSTRETAKSHPGARSTRASSSRKVQRDA